MGDGGWIKLHRKFKNWEWKDSPKHVAVFFDLLLEANHKPKNYRGVTIERGQLTTSYQAISDRTGVSIRGVRTVLRDLKTTNEVTHKPTRHYSVISITNWEKYQMVDKQDDIQTTSKRQPSDKLTTTNKNVKNIKNVKKYDQSHFDLDEIYNAYPKKVGKKKGLDKLKKKIRNQEDFDLILSGAKKYADHCDLNQTDKKYIKHFSTWVNQECWNDEIETEMTDRDILAMALRSAEGGL